MKKNAIFTLLAPPKKMLLAPYSWLRNVASQMAPSFVCFFVVSSKKTLLAPYREIASKLTKYLEKGADNDFLGGQ